MQNELAKYGNVGTCYMALRDREILRQLDHGNGQQSRFPYFANSFVVLFCDMEEIIQEVEVSPDDVDGEIDELQGSQEWS